VSHRAGVVRGNAGLQIVRDAGIEMLCVLLALQNVDVFQGESASAKKLRRDSPRLPNALGHAPPDALVAGLPAFAEASAWPAEPKPATAG